MGTPSLLALLTQYARLAQLEFRLAQLGCLLARLAQLGLLLLDALHFRLKANFLG